MPSKDELKTVLVIGSGPTAVGHGTEYNHAAWKACRLIKQSGRAVIALDSTPSSLATYTADRAYIEPLTADILRKLLEKERPDAILPIAAGRTGLNLCMQVADLLEARGIAALGVTPGAIRAAGDRTVFAELVKQAGGLTLAAEAVASPEQAAAVAARLGFPLVLRPFFVVGGTGSSVVYNLEELKERTFRAIKHSPVGKTLVEKAALGWREVICQVLRDGLGQCVVAGIVETIDPMGVHSGDSTAVFPSQSLSRKQIDRISDLARKLASLAQISASTDIEFAINPRDPTEVVVMEMNPCITRCSAMISIATGFSTVEAAVRLALGDTLADLLPPSPAHPATPSSSLPVPPVVAVRVPRFSFEKFPDAQIELDTVMKSIGESIGLGGSFREAFQKALRGSMCERDGFGFDGRDRSFSAEELTELRRKLLATQPDNYFYIKSALELGMGVAEIASATGIDPFFINEMRALLDVARQLQRQEPSAEMLRRAKSEGFSDAQIANITSRTPEEITAMREGCGVVAAYPAVAASVRYASFGNAGGEAPGLPGEGRRILMIGPGPNTIGCGSEYEFCVSRAAAAFRELGCSCVSVNCSVQGPSADPGLWDALFVVPLWPEDVLAVARAVKPEGVSVQFGGPVSIALAEVLAQNGFRILGTPPESHRRCHCRELRRAMLDKLGMLQPKDVAADNFEEARAAASQIGFPVVVRALKPGPGKTMDVVYNAADLEKVKDFQRPGSQPMLISEFLEDAIEIEIDAVADGECVLIGGIVEHIEEAGIHSGDSACAIPPYTVGEPVIKQMREHVQAIAAELGVRGMLNVQFAIKNDLIYVIEVLPSASLTVPFVSRATELPLIRIAAKVTIGQSLKQQGFTRERMPQQMAVRHSVFPFARFAGVDTVLGPEMKSTGQVMGISDTFGLAFAKAVIGAEQRLPLGGKVFISLKNKDKRPMLFIAKKLEELGFKLLATRGTASALSKNDVKVELISKVSEGRPNIVDLIKNDEVSLIINTPSRKTPSRDEVSIRASAVAHNVPLITTVSGASATVNAIEMTIKRGMEVRSQ